jgi:hypothetical protein
MSLYVANLTNQHYDLHWRRGASAIASFRPGEVRQLPIEHPEHIAEVVKILRQFGAVGAEELRRGQRHRGLAYSATRPRVIKVNEDYHGHYAIAGDDDDVVAE